MQVSYGGLRLEQAYDVVFGTHRPDRWWVIHTPTSRTVISINASWQTAEKITTQIAALLDWPNIETWDEAVVQRFASRYLLEVEVPRYINDPSEWDDDVPYGERQAS